MIYDKPRDLGLKVKKLPQQKNKKEKSNVNEALLTRVLLFFIVLYIGTVISFMIPLRPTYSESEKRDLTKFPKANLVTVLSGSFFDDISLWFSDTFPFREQLTKLNTSLRGLYGFDSISIHGDIAQGDDIPDVPLDIPVTDTTETSVVETTGEQTTLPPATEALTESTTKSNVKIQTMGAIVVIGNSAFEYYNFSNTLAPQYIQAVNNIKSASGNKSNVYSMIIPTSIEIKIDESVRKNINTSDQRKALDYFNASIKNCSVIDVYNAEMAHRNEYTYFRTDHHWTARGAYYAYEQWAITKGVTPVPLENYETRSFDGFLGTFYSSSEKSSALSKTPDFVEAYLPYNNVTSKVVENNGNSYNWEVIADVTNYGESLKYLTFIGGDQPLFTIKNNDLSDGSSCLVIKDSYGNAMVPFLIPHYENIYVIDPRHYNSTLSDFTTNNKVDDIIFISNISTTRNSVFIDAMKGFIK
ncbi:MAG: hypothetical protein KIG53_00730 [Oscillospiraceae bacterium]|nr:hypothetical protein [Oscillospiraceae bacterium]